MGKSGLVIKRQKKENGIEKRAMDENLLYSENVKNRKTKHKPTEPILTNFKVKDQQQQKCRRVNIMTEGKYHRASFHYFIAFKNTEFVWFTLKQYFYT